MNISIIHIIALFSTLLSITNAQQCGEDCSLCDAAPYICPQDTENRCIPIFLPTPPYSLCVPDQCGKDCALCDGNQTTCDADTLPCFYITENNKCRPFDDCQADCTKCTTESNCNDFGAGGTGLCLWDQFNGCEGDTCDTNCDICSGEGEQVCLESTAPPNGCKVESPGSEGCIFQTRNPTTDPTKSPTESPTPNPTVKPTTSPIPMPTDMPTINPTVTPTKNPSISPTINPTVKPTTDPTPLPTEFPTNNPTVTPTKNPSISPTINPTISPSKSPSDNPTNTPTINPTKSPSDNPTNAPNVGPDEIACGDRISNAKLWQNDVKLYSFQLLYDTSRVLISLCSTITNFATVLILKDINYNIIANDTECQPGSHVTLIDISNGLLANVYFITISGVTSNDFGTYQIDLKCETPIPTNNPTKDPIQSPTRSPIDTMNPTKSPTIYPTKNPSNNPTKFPTTTIRPTEFPTNIPTTTPTADPTTLQPTEFPTNQPTITPTTDPIKSPTRSPIDIITPNPTSNPSSPTIYPTINPTKRPSNQPTKFPTTTPTADPTTLQPTAFPTNQPTTTPTTDPTEIPTSIPTNDPTNVPTNVPTTEPITNNPTISPSTYKPTQPQDCPDCPFNVSLIMIGNVTIEECHDSSSSSSSSGSGVWHRRLLKYRAKPWDNSESGSFVSVNDRIKCLGEMEGSKSYSGNSDSYDGTNKFNSIYLNEFTKNKCNDRYSYGSYSYSSSSDSNEDDKEFLTVVCTTYAINDLVNDYSIDCGQVRFVFLNLCENNKTDFNSTNIDANDLTNLIVSYYPNDTNQIINVQGARNENNDLGILIEFNYGHSVTEFKLCLGNVTVDTEFNQEKDSIQIGNGSVLIEDDSGKVYDQCPADGLPCFNFYFGKECETCQCNNGISKLSMQYNGKCIAETILVYSNIQNNMILKEFNNVNNGDVMVIKSVNNVLNDNTYIKIISMDDDCNDWNDRRRLDESSDSDESTDNNNENRCLALFKTDCSSNIVNTKSKGCNVLTAISFTDGNGNFCDKNINNNKDLIDDNNDPNVKRNVLISGKRTNKNAFKLFEELNIYVKWILYCTLIVFVIVIMIAFYICVVHKRKKKHDMNNVMYNNYQRTHLHTLSVTEHNDFEGSYDKNNENNLENAKSVEDDIDDIDLYTETTSKHSFADEYYNECSADLKNIQCVEINDHNNNKC